MDLDQLKQLLSKMVVDAGNLVAGPVRAASASYDSLPYRDRREIEGLMDASNFVPPALAIGFATNPKYLRMAEAFAKKHAGRLPLIKNFLSAANDLPADVWYHGSDKRFPIEEIKAFGIPAPPRSADMNVGLGVHLAAHPNVAMEFTRDSGNSPVYTYKAFGTPLMFRDEAELDAAVLKHAYETGLFDTLKTPNAIETALFGEPNRQTMLKDRYAAGQFDSVVAHLLQNERDIFTTTFIEKMLGQGKDAIMYGNVKEGRWRNNPTLITPFPQAQLLPHAFTTRKAFVAEGLGPDLMPKAAITMDDILRDLMVRTAGR